ncbi:MAG: LptF/LptG family permease [Gemmatimonadaceae bacterium]
MTRRAASAPRRHFRLLRPLDRYVFGEFFRIFVVTALGFPLLVVIIDLVDNLDKYLSRQLPPADIALGYVYSLPETMFLILPAAVLFAAVFSVGNFTRHSEITAAKASGISFYRMIAPIFVGSLLASALGLVVGELAPISSSRSSELLGEREARGDNRSYFVHAGDNGVVYKVGYLDAARGLMDRVEIERRGSSPEYPTIVMTAGSGRWTPTVADSTAGYWTLQDGAVHVLPDSATDLVFQFDSLRARRLRETPLDLTETAREPTDMGYQELGRYITALERAGGDANELRVERALKIAIPVTCLIIVLFGAPLATSTQRGGAAFGIALSLGTTIVFLLLIQLTKAVGGNGVVLPELAAWLPSMLFGLMGLVLLVRVRT